MEEKYLIEKIFFRVAKECGIFNNLIHPYDKYKLKFIKNSILTTYSNYFDISSEIINLMVSYGNMDSKVLKDFKIKLDKVIFGIVKDNIFYFLNDRKVTENFVRYLKQRNFVNVNDYLEHLQTYNYSPINVISEAFCWSETKNGYEYWKTINKDFFNLCATLLF